MATEAKSGGYLACRLSPGEREALAGRLFPHSEVTPAGYEAIYPPRALPPGAMVTRLGPSPTGFVHLGNLYGALADERLAHQSGGVFILRVEDTDEKREVPGAVELLIDALAYFGLRFDEGETAQGDKGDYGPYRQRRRAAIYQAIAKYLVERGRAYPCFCTEAELAALRERQAAAGENPGYYGSWAAHRDLPLTEINERLERGEPFVIRLRSLGEPDRAFTLSDGIRGRLTMPENRQDFVLLKADGIPTYHFAHVVDDHFMRVTHILRGEEWLATLPYHWELFQALDWRPPVFCHTAVLMKMEDGVKRKLSKRKDPELGLDYYRQLGYHPAAARAYLLTVLNSHYEEWRLANPLAPLEDFPFTTAKMGSSGALFDLDKLRNVSKDTFAAMTAGEAADFLLAWAGQWEPGTGAVLAAERAYLEAVLNIGRGGDNPRKDLIYGRQILDFISFFFDPWFGAGGDWLAALPERLPPGETAAVLLEEYAAGWDFAEDRQVWFGKVRELGERWGFAARPKDYQKNPTQYKGHVGDVSGLLRAALTGRRDSPDLWEIQRVMGEKRCRSRLAAAAARLRQGPEQA
ncbi:MAG: glutamate--tRNA ligase [Peptococcaceae bacterium]|jgi:glutamyl-tRNA synthetase|nr:glutamate--tRNA ligase [Peptococcaceae bacterium]